MPGLTGHLPIAERTVDTRSALQFCHELHRELAIEISDPVIVRGRVESLRAMNGCRESRFCKGCILPIVDRVATRFLTTQFHVSRAEIRRALRCEGFNTPMYTRTEAHSGFSSHSRSNSYHPGDKSGRRQQSRRSPDFCIRSADQLRIVGELKHLPRVSPAITAQVVRELRDYLAIASEPTSDWGHDFGFGLIYGFGGDTPHMSQAALDYWESDHIFLSLFA
jgi:hypothetical protein